jgi:hypothetical protein
VEPTYSDPLFYNESARAQCNSSPVLVHNNWLVGRANKIVCFRLHGLWSISGEQPEREWRHTSEACSLQSRSAMAFDRLPGTAKVL